MIPSSLSQQIHVRKQSNNVVGQRNCIVVAAVGGVGQHHFGQIFRERLVSLIYAVDAAGIDEVAEEGAGPGEEDVGQIGAGIHCGLDLGLVGLIFKSFPLNLDVGMCRLKLGDSRFIGGTVGVAFRGDAPHGQDSLICSRLSCGGGCGLSCGSSCRGSTLTAGGQCNDHAECECKRKNLFHGVSSCFFICFFLLLGLVFCMKI